MNNYFAQKLIIISFLLFSFTSFGQNNTDHLDDSERNWNDLKSYALKSQLEQLTDNEKYEILQLRITLREFVNKELEIIENLSQNLLTNFVIIEDHFRNEFFELDLHYLDYDDQHPDYKITKEEWVQFHTEKIKNYKISLYDIEIEDMYD
ncbi:hypothetical protein [Flammeovirga pacifica]|uniref:Uncharacterized protein n=1 Tax=Flammeovirga pacifica TaxID=915059 RepID=A0A1S1Z2Y2_FLAPC|nr:hypothetical protein [Flammeovirga pacifica]OHX67601.1 hypothetical protein NH26_15205 [Flammeovirga pacifica]